MLSRGRGRYDAKKENETNQACRLVARSTGELRLLRRNKLQPKEQGRFTQLKLRYVRRLRLCGAAPVDYDPNDPW
jgi:2-oxo-4-hydroxy-4-carboxy--5-ureidoimidazoline (OHCU) decarboxylase